MGMFYFIAVWRELKSITYYPFPSNLKRKIIFESNCAYVFTKQYIKTNLKSENFTVIGLVVFLQRAVNWKAVSYMSFFFYALIIIFHICNFTFFLKKRLSLMNMSKGLPSFAVLSFLFNFNSRKSKQTLIVFVA